MHKLYGLFLCLLTMSLHAQVPSLRAVVGESSAQTLMTNGILYNEDMAPQVKFVQSGVLREQMTTYINEVGANLSLEFLYFVPASQHAKRSNKDVVEALLHIRTLGTAYMIRNDKEQALFSNVEVLDNFQNRKKINSPVSVTIPFSYQRYISLKDARFGKIDYRVDYLADNQNVVVSMLNFSTLSYMMRKIADSQKMRLSFMQQEVSEGMLYVGHITAQIHNLDKAKESIHLPSFFSRRVEGMKGWYFQQVHGIKVNQGVYPVKIAP
ncbi:DUF6675 family protein [Entomospira culicis]|uniref:Uncharacterized protein n=1 Tax=Entomospira culicis TaxID=2719989 RepID=A0A968KUW4_9SPIO|nr:DUF6675 family protein [Entomospira culicis]NIZ19550.1 hypothetical protein [Entomospira culicis]NIZ69545.1 hypothetical protein [Entomospira culicis]WDI36656.1 hypothetical protein PVA46_04850 [Entomospira culicis]WDI38285.1 hypothetical protein PVA47_04860 [Entomospira culicis]